MRRRFLTSPLLALAITIFPAPAAFTQGAGEDRSPVGWASLQFEPGRPTLLQVVGRTRDPEVAAAIARIAGRTPRTTVFGSDWSQWTVELPVPTRTGLVLRQDIRLDPLLEVFGARGEHSLSLFIQHPPAGYVNVRGAMGTVVDRSHVAVSLATIPPTVAISVELGWRARDVARSATLLVLALVAPILFGLAIWKRSIARDRSSERWFFRAQANQLAAIVGLVVWMAVVEATRVADLVEFAFQGPDWPRMITGPMWMIGYLPTAFAMSAITRRVVRRLRGFDPSPRGAERFASLRPMILLALLVLGLAGLAAGSPQVAVAA